MEKVHPADTGPTIAIRGTERIDFLKQDTLPGSPTQQDNAPVLPEIPVVPDVLTPNGAVGIVGEESSSQAQTEEEKKAQDREKQKSEEETRDEDKLELARLEALAQEKRIKLMGEEKRLGVQRQLDKTQTFSNVLAAGAKGGFRRQQDQALYLGTEVISALCFRTVRFRRYAMTLRCRCSPTLAISGRIADGAWPI